MAQLDLSDPGDQLISLFGAKQIDDIALLCLSNGQHVLVDLHSPVLARRRVRYEHVWGILWNAILGFDAGNDVVILIIRHAVHSWRNGGVNEARALFTQLSELVSSEHVFWIAVQNLDVLVCAHAHDISNRGRTLAAGDALSLDQHRYHQAVYRWAVQGDQFCAG